MSFEKLNETSISNIHDRSCVIIVNANNVIIANNKTPITVPNIPCSFSNFSNCSNKFTICGAINNSDGFGGIFPAEIKYKLSISVS